MDFFSRQEDAQQKSRSFFLAFALAMAATVIIYYLAITLGLLAICAPPWRLSYGPGASQVWAVAIGALPEFIYGSPQRIIALRPFLILAGLIVAVILAASSYKVRAIKMGGGAYLAEAMGAALIQKPRNPEETQLLNVVEEMAVASSLPHPRVYILQEEPTINAVTGGLRPDDAVIVVTQGAISHLNRQELRAVVAHEFAHILNGDFSLNLTMAGWLYGLIFISMKGQELLGGSLEVMDRMLGGNYYRFGGLFTNYPGLNLIGCIALIPGLLAGLGLAVGGWIGRVAAAAVQAAFSRQREYLADAFAVQFTRETAGLAGALKKIAGLPRHGVLRSGQAIMMKAFFIVSPSQADGFLKTHPPLEKRIRALEPDWDGAFIVLDHPDFRPPEARNDYHLPLRTSLAHEKNLKRLDQRPLTRAQERFQENWAAAVTTLSLLAGGLPGAPDPAGATGLTRAGGAETAAGPEAAAAQAGPAAGLLGAVKTDVLIILTALARLDAAGPEDAERAYAAGLAHFSDQWGRAPMLEPEAADETSLARALERSGQAPDNIRRLLALAAVATVIEDGQVTPGRYRLLSSLSEALKIPLSPPDPA